MSSHGIAGVFRRDPVDRGRAVVRRGRRQPHPPSCRSAPSPPPNARTCPRGHGVWARRATRPPFVFRVMAWPRQSPACRAPGTRRRGHCRPCVGTTLVPRSAAERHGLQPSEPVLLHALPLRRHPAGNQRGRATPLRNRVHPGRCHFRRSGAPRAGTVEVPSRLPRICLAPDPVFTAWCTSGTSRHDSAGDSPLARHSSWRSAGTVTATRPIRNIMCRGQGLPP